tara:strand:+ start:13 stop:858 length:846 start_codon:yes stop_codon:yes gene_type:complete
MIIWLASYPKSGNTWVRAMLSSLIYSKDGIFNFEFLKYINKYPQKEHFEELTNKFNDINELSKFWISSQNKINSDKKIKFLKTHHLRCSINNNNFTNHENTIATIYIVRDPRDVIISYAKHHSLTIENTKLAMFNSQNYTFPQTVNENERLTTMLGSWADHYNSWIKNNKNLLMIKYEDLISDTKKELLKILNFVNIFVKIPIDETKVEKCLNSTTFENMKNMEEKGFFNENTVDENTGKKIVFFNKGKKNEWKKNLNSSIKEQIEIKFKKEMFELGYLEK